MGVEQPGAGLPSAARVQARSLPGDRGWVGKAAVAPLSCPLREKNEDAASSWLTGEQKLIRAQGN